MIKPCHFETNKPAVNPCNSKVQKARLNERMTAQRTSLREVVSFSDDPFARTRRKTSPLEDPRVYTMASKRRKEVASCAPPKTEVRWEQA